MSSSVSLQPLQSDSYPGANPIDDWAVMDAPGRTLYARGRPGDLDTAELTVPSLLLVANGGGTAKLNAPSRSYSLSGTVENVGRLDADAPGHSLTASGYIGGIGTAQLTGIRRSLAAFSGAVAELEKSGYGLSASGTTGANGVALLYTPDFTLEATATQENYGTAILTGPVATSLWGIARDLQVPGVSLTASGQEVLVPAYAAYAINTENVAATRYTNYDFDFIVRYEGQYYGCGPNGIVLLEGADDAGTPIDASFELNPTDFEVDRQKRLTHAYLGARMAATEQLTVGAAPDEGTFRNTLTTRQHRNRRAQFPRGLKGRYWGLRVENVDGGDLDVDSIRIVTENLKRRL